MTQKCPLWVAFIVWVLGIMEEQKLLQPHVIWLSEGTFHLQTQKHFSQNAKLYCIFEIVSKLCKILHDSSRVLYTVLHISRENMREEKFWFVCFVPANMLCTTTHSHKPEFVLSQIFSWLCSSVYSTECGVMQNFAELWHNFENAV